MKIFLIGYMGVGKTTVGKKLAKYIDFEFVDLDDCFEKEYKIAIPLFFQKYGEANFRKLERKVLEKNLCIENVVISTGGGLPCFFDNMDLMRKSGLCVYIKMSVSSLVMRLSNAKKKRPILRGMDEYQMREHIEKQLAERALYYNQADICINGVSLNVAELAQKIELFDKKV